jgi:hypothetical protein
VNTGPPRDDDPRGTALLPPWVIEEMDRRRRPREERRDRPALEVPDRAPRPASAGRDLPREPSRVTVIEL